MNVSRADFLLCEEVHYKVYQSYRIHYGFCNLELRQQRHIKGKVVGNCEELEQVGRNYHKLKQVNKTTCPTNCLATTLIPGLSSQLRQLMVFISSFVIDINRELHKEQQANF